MTDSTTGIAFVYRRTSRGGAAILEYLDGRRLYPAHDDLNASTLAARLRG
jgi:hypothetical protein